MKRDVDLLRTILLAVEAEQRLDEIEGYSRETVMAHVRLLSEAGFLAADDQSTRRRLDFYVSHITWSGYELLERMRNDSAWAKTKRFLAEKLQAMPFTLLMKVLDHELEGML